MTSVINGLPLSGANRYTAAGKSPLTGGFGEAEAGGYWGPELKRSGLRRRHRPRPCRAAHLSVSTTARASSATPRRYWGQLSGRGPGRAGSGAGRQAHLRAPDRHRRREPACALRPSSTSCATSTAGPGSARSWAARTCKAIVVRGKERVGPAGQGRGQGRRSAVPRALRPRATTASTIDGTSGGITGLEATASCRPATSATAPSRTPRRSPARPCRHDPDRPRHLLRLRGRLQARGRGQGAGRVAQVSAAWSTRSSARSARSAAWATWPRSRRCRSGSTATSSTPSRPASPSPSRWSATRTASSAEMTRTGSSCAGATPTR